MAGEWNKTTLGNICVLRAGSVFPPALQGKTTGTYPFAKVSDMNLAANAFRIRDANNWVDDADLRQVKTKPFPAGTTVFAKIGEALKANRLRFIDRPTIIDNNMMGAVPRADTVNARFLFYALSQFDFGEVAGGTALPYLTVGALSKLDITLPPLFEQRAIAHILGTLDDKIEVNRRMSATLEAMARALFKSWFVDFEPVRAKAEGRDPGLPPHLAALFPNGFDENGKPEGWRTGPLSDLSVIVMGASPKGESYNTKRIGVPLVNGPTEYGDFFLTQDKWTTKPTRLSENGDLIICVRGSTTGRHAYSDAHYCLGRGVAAVRALNSYQVYVDRIILDDMARLLAKVTGSVFPNLSSDDFNGFEILIPQENVIKAFCKKAEPIRERVWAIARERETLANLRDTLLPKLISGELRVKDAETFLDRAL